MELKRGRLRYTDKQKYVIGARMMLPQNESVVKLMEETRRVFEGWVPRIR